jgi:cobaltochelatase CobN
VLEDYPEKMDEVICAMKKSDVVLLYHTSDVFWERLDKESKEIGKTVPIICMGTDPLMWGLSTVEIPVVATCQTYLTNNGDENFKNLLNYIEKMVLGMDVPVTPPITVPWEGLYHPDAFFSRPKTTGHGMLRRFVMGLGWRSSSRGPLGPRLIVP